MKRRPRRKNGECCYHELIGCLSDISLREYIEALQNEMVEKDQKHMLDQLLAEAQSVV
jgi:hypothetical protein